MFKVGKHDKVVSKQIMSNSNKKAIILYHYDSGMYQVQIVSGFLYLNTLDEIKSYKRLGNAENFLSRLGFHGYLSQNDYMEINRLISHV